MADPVSARCGLCGKGFKLRPEQLGREVRCPHCKTIVVIEKQTDAAREAIEALGEQAAAKRPVTAHRQVRLPRGGVRNKGLAIAWVAILAGVLLIVIIVAAVVATRNEPPAEGNAAGGGTTGRDPYVAPEPRVLVYGDGDEEPDEPPQDGSYWPPPAPATRDAGPAAPGPAGGGIAIRPQGSLAGLEGGTASYRCGTVHNGRSEPVQGLLITSRARGADGTVFGEATALIRHLEPGEEAPFVAVWRHDPGLRPEMWTDDQTIDPNLVPVPEARVIVDGDVWYDPDRGEYSRTGEIIVPVRNVGRISVRRIEVSAIIYHRDGSVLSAVKTEVGRTLLPGAKAEELRVRYERATRTLIGQVVADAQAAMRR